MPSTAFARTNYADTLNILKGCGLLALVLINCNHWYAAAPLPDKVYALHASLPDHLIQQFLDYFVSGQCYAFLAFLLGIQFFNASKRERRQQKPDYLRRYLILFLVGLAHQALWNGDVLLTYAIAGMLLVFMEKLGANFSLFLGLLFISNLPGFFISIFAMVLQGKPPEHSAAVAVANASTFEAIMEKGGPVQIVVFNISNILSKYKHLLLTGQFFRVTGFFTLGFYAGRINLIQQVKDSNRPWGLVMMICSALFLAALYMQLSLYKNSNALVLEPARYMVENLEHVFATIAYILLGILLLQYERIFELLRSTGAVGKLWLSNYLIQTLIGIALFYGAGAGLYPVTGALQNVFIAISIFVAQLVFSVVWLRYFYDGPLEWLWRSAAAYRWRRMRRS